MLAPNRRIATKAPPGYSAPGPDASLRGAASQLMSLSDLRSDSRKAPSTQGNNR